ncbi:MULTISPECIES: hypothetical protein [Vibrio]|uniref:hypothetical protein n=1 Tax=Vibrio TaxID=662 RepID=UPI000B8E7C58|nr:MULTISPECIES: hypothetical protein [Vibrio]MDE1238844.1 hypothetical protein [Vibrio aestuarianus]NAW91319.1 hypothetical protein [Vibrio sp. V24_P1S3T111]OXX20975.1 hypothetical protein B9J86_11780 [Vibrio sp. V06_P1A73T115]OXX21829.1 hypothetical protein B9J88_11085 [Vibrio sp. V05_P4A8T149]OXX28040.1 hypothetical protein B9J95_17725 [Vibrio sp. V14_P6S14T42]
MTKTRNPEVTRKKLLGALQRLIDQKPERLSGKYKINVKSVQEEAGLSLGSAYRYPEVMDAIEEQKLAIAKRDIRKRSVKTDLERLREEKAKEKALKEKYRSALDEANEKLDKLYAEQTMQQMAMFNLLDIDDKARLLQDFKPKVIRIK